MSDDTGRPSGAGDGDEVGSVGEEAAKLLGALSGWAKTHGGDLGHGLSDVASPRCTTSTSTSRPEHPSAATVRCAGWCTSYATSARRCAPI